jgi:hypothetical protein
LKVVLVKRHRMEHEDGGRTAAIAGTGFMAGVKIALAAARFHSVGVARAGPWNTVENKTFMAANCSS